MILHIVSKSDREQAQSQSAYVPDFFAMRDLLIFPCRIR